MTIQNLAALYDEHTGSKMSRQNLTQRLKRDNFPEQDMHVIAALLGYQVSVQLTPSAIPVPEYALKAPVVPAVPKSTPAPAAVPLPEIPSASASDDSGMTFNIPDAFRKVKPQGDINPLTGDEYLTNTVRRHPQMPEYVQVYDRTTHEWNDVREDYFWEFQKKKKQMMGNDYRAPIMI